MVVEAFGDDLALCNLVKLRYSVSQNSVFGCRELGMSSVVDIAQVIDHILHLVFVSDGNCKSLKLQLFDADSFTITDGLDNGIQTFLILPLFLFLLLIGQVGILLVLHLTVGHAIILLLHLFIGMILLTTLFVLSTKLA